MADRERGENDQEEKDRQQDGLREAREEHNRRTGGGVTPERISSAEDTERQLNREE